MIILRLLTVTMALALLGFLPAPAFAVIRDPQTELRVSSCTLSWDARNLRITILNVCGDPPYKAEVRTPNWNFSVESPLQVNCGDTVTLTQKPKDARWLWPQGTYTAAIYRSTSRSSIATCSTVREMDEASGIGMPGARFQLPEDPTIFKNLPFFALFGGGVGSGAIGLLTLLLALGLIASFVFFVLGAFKYLLSTGDPKKVEGAKNQITAAIIGLVIMASAFFIVQVLERILGIRVTG